MARAFARERVIHLETLTGESQKSARAKAYFMEDLLKALNETDDKFSKVNALRKIKFELRLIYRGAATESSLIGDPASEKFWLERSEKIPSLQKDLEDQLSKDFEICIGKSDMLLYHLPKTDLNEAEIHGCDLALNEFVSDGTDAFSLGMFYHAAELFAHAIQLMDRIGDTDKMLVMKENLMKIYYRISEKEEESNPLSSETWKEKAERLYHEIYPSIRN